MTTKQFFFIALTLLTTGCSVSVDNGENKAPGERNPPQEENKNTHFFKATGGEHGFITPLVGVRLFDNNSFVYVAVRECETPDKEGAINRISISNSGKAVSEEPKMGGIGQWNNQCSFNADFKWSDNSLKVTGPYLRVENALDIEMSRITQDEFFRGLKAITTDKGLNYRILPRDEREEFDQTCKDLAGTETCDPLLK